MFMEHRQNEPFPRFVGSGESVPFDLQCSPLNRPIFNPNSLYFLKIYNKY